VILSLIFIISSAKTLESPAMISMLPALVPTSILPRATAANAVSGQAAQIVGPALGGFLYAAGAEVVYAVTAGLYLLSLMLVLTLRYDRRCRRVPRRRFPHVCRCRFYRKARMS
jgi:MFS family permease